MKIVTYNINGIRASCKLGLLEWVRDFGPDIFCVQEVRCEEDKLKEIVFPTSKQMSLFESTENILKDYTPIYNCGTVAGYAGTMILTKIKPDKIFYDMGEFWKDNEGRTTTIIIKDYAIINAYIPNGNSRLDFKMRYIDALKKYIQKLQQDYKVLCMGDYNIAHTEIDLTNPIECRNKSVFLPSERKVFGELLDIGLIDSFRYLNPNKIAYSWRSYRSRTDTNYNSWKYRIDYILVSKTLKDNLISCEMPDLTYSDHLPVILDIDLK